MSKFIKSWYNQQPEHNNDNGITLFFVLIAMCLFGMCHSGCDTPTKAQRQIDHVAYKYPQLVSKICADRFPPAIGGAQFVPGDTVDGTPYYEIDTPTDEPSHYTISLLDSSGYISISEAYYHMLVNSSGRIKIIPRYIHDTTKTPFENTAKITYLNGVIHQLELDRADSSVSKAKVMQKITTKNKWLLWESVVLGALLVCGVIYLIIKLK